MPSIGLLAALFVLVPVVELMLLIRMGQWLGFWPTVAFVVLTGWAGATLAGALLLAPGVLTDLTGLALLFPPTRRIIQRWVRKRLEKGIMSGSIRVMTMAPGTPSPRPRSDDGLDPSKGIVIESDES
jgi:UPF0716 protein FxsA